MAIGAGDAASYLKEYVQLYRQEYQGFIAPSPTGSGHAALSISPYLQAPELICYLASDGAAIAVSSSKPSESEIAGLPRMLMKLGEGVTASHAEAHLRQRGLWEIWCGTLPHPLETAEEIVAPTRIHAFRYDMDLVTLLGRLTFGSLGDFEPQLRSLAAKFWNPAIIRDMCFGTTDKPNERLFHYLELLLHVEAAAWDRRSLWVRVPADIRRDYAFAVTNVRFKGQYGSITLGTSEELARGFFDRLSALKEAIEGFSKLLDTQREEHIFHEYLKVHPVLLDIYGAATSKPRFEYPKGDSPIDKEYVEPDFVICYVGNVYKLVELESPSKWVATKKGHPRSEMSQAAFQIGEWKEYIAEHYDRLKERFPGISVNCKSMVVISRASERSMGPGDMRRRMSQVRLTYGVDEIVSYDELLERAKEAYIRLTSMPFVRKA